MKTNRYRKLDVYQEAKLLVKNVYLHLQQFPKEEQFALCDQLRRAVISIPSNIAEGMGRSSAKDQAHFLEIAYGSLLETQCQLEIALDLGYLSEASFNMLDDQIDHIAIMLSRLRALRLPPNRLATSPSSLLAQSTSPSIPLA